MKLDPQTKRGGYSGSDAKTIKVPTSQGASVTPNHKHVWAILWCGCLQCTRCKKLGISEEKG